MQEVGRLPYAENRWCLTTIRLVCTPNDKHFLTGSLLAYQVAGNYFLHHVLHRAIWEPYA